ncbi:hypothetical protein [Bacillus solimangrovi]|uniref:Uncharacterized protein n=1 Tax=Bacillus solimangrovi TaxID=1305675 RepID=A0A1E5LJ86_9BACI|nr:hypothetical protein [Bacillus solimangrovi]OEH94088.1 hypothetical protein BFG57_09585 [Bacillus solimangrovi]
MALENNQLRVRLDDENLLQNLSVPLYDIETQSHETLVTPVIAVSVEEGVAETQFNVLTEFVDAEGALETQSIAGEILVSRILNGVSEQAPTRLASIVFKV